jgi:hypothetical protein
LKLPLSFFVPEGVQHRYRTSELFLHSRRARIRELYLPQLSGIARRRMVLLFLSHGEGAQKTDGNDKNDSREKSHTCLPHSSKHKCEAL